MKSRVVFIPFDLFGSPGAAAGVHLLAEAFSEMLEDNDRESRPTRSRAYQDSIVVEEIEIETMDQVRDWRETASRVARSTLRRGEFLVWLGGNHLTALPVFESLRRDTLVFQFDAHLDVYNLAGCIQDLSHGNFLRNASRPLPPIVHLGHRDQFLTAQDTREHFQVTISAEHIALASEDSFVELRSLARRAKRVWIDIDCDVLDPAFFPAVSHAVPFGLVPTTLLRLVDSIWSDRVLGISISEFVPARDDRDRSLELLMWLIEWVLLRRHEQCKGDGSEVHHG